jgi:hypothetical protein
MGLSDFRKKQEDISTSEDKLSIEELDFLLQLIASSSFEGKDVQLVYQTALKIQNLIKKG